STWRSKEEAPFQNWNQQQQTTFSKVIFQTFCTCTTQWRDYAPLTGYTFTSSEGYNNLRSEKQILAAYH
ncbi:hypothetical protein SK128_028480, partial [Halocaridina rubra]